MASFTLTPEVHALPQDPLLPLRTSVLNKMLIAVVIKTVAMKWCILGYGISPYNVRTLT